MSGDDGKQFIVSCSLAPGSSRGNDAPAIIDSSSLSRWRPEGQAPRMLQPSNAHQEAQALMPSSGAPGYKNCQEQQQQRGAVAPYAFDTSLLDIVADVEGLLAPSTGVQHQKLAFSQLCCLNSTLPPQTGNGGQQDWISSPRWDAYEETDLLSLIADIE